MTISTLDINVISDSLKDGPANITETNIRGIVRDLGFVAFSHRFVLPKASARRKRRWSVAEMEEAVRSTYGDDYLQALESTQIDLTI